MNSAHSLLQYVFSTSSLPTLRTCLLNGRETLLNCRAYTLDDRFGWQEARGSARDKPEICLYHPQFINTSKLVECRWVHRQAFVRIKKAYGAITTENGTHVNKRLFYHKDLGHHFSESSVTHESTCVHRVFHAICPTSGAYSSIHLEQNVQYAEISRSLQHTFEMSVITLMHAAICWAIECCQCKSPSSLMVPTAPSLIASINRSLPLGLPPRCTPNVMQHHRKKSNMFKLCDR